MAADLAADLSANGGEVTAKLNTDQWVVVRIPHICNFISAYLIVV